MICLLGLAGLARSGRPRAWNVVEVYGSSMLGRLRAAICMVQLQFL